MGASPKERFEGSNVRIIGQYEIYREEEMKASHGSIGRAIEDNINMLLVEGEVRESINSHTSGIASEANIPPVHSEH